MRKPKKSSPTLNPADVSLLIGAMKVVFPTRNEVEQMFDEKLNEKIGRLPTKDEFNSRMDQLSGEYKKIDEAETLHAGALSAHDDTLENHDQRLKSLENRFKSTPTPVASAI